MNIHPLAVLVAIFGSGGLVSSHAGAGSTNQAESTFYRTQAQADAALKAFDRKNPTCQLWSNWQKMCSRTGVGGKTFCTTNSTNLVRPSTPFCAGDAKGLDRIEAATLTNEQISRDRFCVSFDSTSTFARKLGRPSCYERDKRRPFGGFEILSRVHPWCKEWKDKRTFQIVDVKSGASSEAGFYCSKTRVPKWCKQADGLGLIPLDSPDDPDFGKGKIRVLAVVDSTANARIVGVMCRKRA